MAAGKRSGRIRRSERDWRRILERFDSSGLSAREFCEQEGLSPSSLQRWRARCRARSTARFVELPAATAVDERASGADWSVELELPGGLRLRLRA